MGKQLNRKFSISNSTLLAEMSNQRTFSSIGLVTLSWQTLDQLPGWLLTKRQVDYWLCSGYKPWYYWSALVRYHHIIGFPGISRRSACWHPGLPFPWGPDSREWWFSQHLWDWVWLVVPWGHCLWNDLWQVTVFWWYFYQDHSQHSQLSGMNCTMYWI